MVELNSDRLTESYLNFIAIKESLAYVQKESFRRNDDAFQNTIGFPYVNQSIKDRKSFVNSKMEEMVNSMDELIVLGLLHSDRVSDHKIPGGHHQNLLIYILCCAWLFHRLNLL